MYGDIRPGDTTHQDVMMAYKNFHSNAPRNLLKELPAEADKFKIWEVFSDIVQVYIIRLVSQFNLFNFN